jgi:hypothetical protein
MLYAPRSRIPTLADAAAGRTLVRIMGRFEGPVLLLNHGYLPSLAGKQTWSQGMAVFDVLRGGDVVVKQKLLGEMRDAIRTGKFDAVITDERGILEDWFLADIERHYELRGAIFGEKNVFWPTTGHTMRPGNIYTRRE